MRFTEFSIPESTQSMEKSDILFILDFEKNEVPFVNSSFIQNSGRNDLISIITQKIHPDDWITFQKIAKGKSINPAIHNIRVFDKNDNLLTITFHRLKVSGKQNKELLLGILCKTSQEPVHLELAVNS